MNWIEEYKNYCDYLQCEALELPGDQKQAAALAKKLLTEEINNIIATNGEEYLNDREIEYCRKLGIKLEQEHRTWHDVLNSAILQTNLTQRRQEKYGCR